MTEVERGAPDNEDDAAPDEELIESTAPSTRMLAIRRRLERLVLAMVSRKVLGGMAVGALVLGLVAGFLVGSVAGTEPTASTDVQEGPPPDGRYIPDTVLAGEQGVVVLATAAGSLTNEDLATVDEIVLPRASALALSSGLDGLCGTDSTPEVIPFPQGPGVAYGVLGSVVFTLADATLSQRIGPDLDVLSASTLRGTVEVARTCPSSAELSVTTDGIQSGIGDEYAVFTVSRLGPSEVTETSIIVLVRVGGRLIELTLRPEGAAEVPDGPARILRIAEVAVARMLAG